MAGLRLSPRKRQVAALVAEGHTYREVARRADLKPNTVKMYVEDIAAKIHGDLPAKVKVQVWFRMAHGLSIFTGAPIEIDTTAPSNSNGDRAG